MNITNDYQNLRGWNHTLSYWGNYRTK